MKNKELRIIYIVASALIALVLLLGGYNLYQKYLVEKPLIEELKLENEVEQVEISREKKVYTINIHLDQVENLQDSYLKIEAVTEEHISQGNYKIEIIDRPNSKLEKFFADLQPVLYQGLARQEFLWLDEQIEARSRDEGISARLLVDGQRLYLQLQDSDSYLYRVIENSDVEQGAEGGRTN